MSPKILAVFFIAGGILIVFALSGFQIVNLFSPGITEEVTIEIKQNDVCIVEASDNIPRQIRSCPYELGQAIMIAYKSGQPSILSHSPI
ncbi:MAG: hypothetical protein ACRD8Z_13175 [Nitrososphaeraceae archaeon]